MIGKILSDAAERGDQDLLDKVARGLGSAPAGERILIGTLGPGTKVTPSVIEQLLREQFR